MSADERGIPFKRESTRKRCRNSLKSQLTPVKKIPSYCRGRYPDSTGEMVYTREKPDVNATEYYSDNEDLFGGYDSILDDSSLLAELDNEEQNVRKHDLDLATKTDQHQPDNFTALRSAKEDSPKTSCEEKLSDSVLDAFSDESFKYIQDPHRVIQKDFCKNAGKGQTSTPFKKKESSDGVQNDTDRHVVPPKARRSMTDHLKRTMLCNAAAPSNVSLTSVQKRAVVTEEITVAMQAMDTISIESPDLGPFFGLPTKVKELICSSRGITDLYGD